MELPAAEVDRLWGTDQKCALGDTWEVDVDQMTKVIKKQAADQGRQQLQGLALKKGTGKIGKVTSTGDMNLVELEVQIEANMENEGVAAKMSVSFGIQLPRDGTTGPVRVVAKLKARADLPLSEIPNQPDPKMTLKTTTSETITTDIKYLGNSSVDPAPSPKDSEPSLAPQANLGPAPSLQPWLRSLPSPIGLRP
jgi:hypothetical protein